MKIVFEKAVVLVLGCLGLSKEFTQPVSPDEGVFLSDGLHLNDSPRIKLSDGRILTYKERGAPRDESDYKVIVVHGFASSKDMIFMASQEFLDGLRIYLLLFDRAGYGESDPNPRRTLQSEASDIEELADKLKLGSKFYVIGNSLGSYPVWSSLTCIAKRLSGIALVVPYINYNWPSLPQNLTKNDGRKFFFQVLLLAARYIPRDLLMWIILKIFPSSNSVHENPSIYSERDLELKKLLPEERLLTQNMLRKRGVFDSVCSDIIMAFGRWDFDPLDQCDPYPQNESTVHIWQGCDDKIVPVQLQRHVSSKLPWIHYHEVQNAGHLLVYDSQVCETILRSLLLQEDPPMYIRENPTNCSFIQM